MAESVNLTGNAYLISENTKKNYIFVKLVFYLSRKRISFTKHQLALLREIYVITKYPSREQVESLTKTTNLSTERIEVKI